jgi:hypothetical protein
MITKRVKYIYLSFILSTASFVIYSLLKSFGSSELLFLGLSILFLVGFFLTFFYSAVEFAVDKQPVDLWKVGFLGILGLLGVIPGLASLFAIFALFFLFGTRNYY